MIGFSPRESSSRIIQSAQLSQSVNQLSSPIELQLTQFKDMLREAMPDVLKDYFENYALSMGWKPSSPRMSNIVSISSYFAFSCFTLLCPVNTCFQIIYKLDLDQPLQWNLANHVSCIRLICLHFFLKKKRINYKYNVKCVPK